ncbi:MAG: aspartate 1-decarboxylase [Candidatus Omnitrophota bacterium]
MFRMMCKSKIHRATITKKDLHYSGSIGVDKALLEASDILPNEMVQVLNLNNGERFETYIVEEEEGSGTIALYGPAAYKGEAGDLVIIISYGIFDEKETRQAVSRVVLVDGKNKITKKKEKSNEA